MRALKVSLRQAESLLGRKLLDIVRALTEKTVVTLPIESGVHTRTATDERSGDGSAPWKHHSNRFMERKLELLDRTSSCAHERRGVRCLAALARRHSVEAPHGTEQCRARIESDLLDDVFNC
jgi:hypothetical protein